MKRLILQSLLVSATMMSLLSASDPSVHTESCRPERINVKIRAKAITDRKAFVYYHLAKTGNRPLFIQKYHNEVAKTTTNLEPGQSITINAAFAPGRETRANTFTLTYGEAQRLAQSVKPSGGNGAKLAYTWEPTFDLSKEA